MEKNKGTKKVFKKNFQNKIKKILETNQNKTKITAESKMMIEKIKNENKTG